MKQVKVRFFTGREEFNMEIAKRLLGVLASYDIVVTDNIDDADIGVCTPEYCRLFEKIPIVVLTDSVDSFFEVGNAVEWTPIPITDDDFLRLEFRLIGVAHAVQLDDDV